MHSTETKEPWESPCILILLLFKSVKSVVPISAFGDNRNSQIGCNRFLV
jgi:hypothetical protein